ncbi:T9SS type A sorting domain-containing protein [Aequorivita sp. CIP111184]|uniref:T9SS type A sorting domain-containing protein n=1 Tax=Aequorivita sp. CIP111184 TaxID=2211356 RepID=UPI000DBC1862|nr:T9SS type A sorting domain-containing protein [Aequorivita sp. CIP111184]SRX54180.1 hypothetical protein AEQU1_01185 [Aequorivita sp. CIP111184]
MKRFLFFSILSIFCLTISAQTKTWIGPSGGYFSTAANWNPAGVPGSGNDVIIPTGSNLYMDGANVKSFDIQGNSQVNMTNTVYFTNASSIAANSSFTWSGGYLQGMGILNNNGSFTVQGNSNKYMQESFIFTNAGTINFPDGFYLWLTEDAVINNTVSGIIDFQSDANIIAGGSASRMLNNAGLIKKTGGTYSTIDIKMINTGTISAESGTLNLGIEQKTLDGGIYNVTSGNLLSISAGNINMSGTLTGQLDGELKCGSYGGNITVTNAATVDFSGSGFKWDTGHLVGDGVLTNNGIFNFSSNANRYIDGATTLNNLGIINFVVGCDVRTQDNSIFYNAPSGVIDFQSDAIIDYGGSGTHIFNNAGLIKKTVGTISSISAAMINTGTISVETGMLDLSYQEKTLDGGIYNVNSGSELRVSAGNINMSGTLTGQLDGEMKCGSYGNYITVADAATLNFNGNGFSWDNGHLVGNGVLTNNGIFNFSSNANRYMEGTTSLANQGTINITTGFTLFVSNDSVLYNKVSGVIDFQIEASIGSDQNGVINNAGLIEKTSGTGVAYINVNTNNSGIIDVMSGELEFMDGRNFTNMTGGKVMGTATIDVPAAANFTNNGIFSPGGYPGTLTVISDFKSSSTSELQIEIYGTTQGSEYDLLAVQGNAIMDGNIVVAVYNEINLDDEFVVVTANSITSCNLPATVSANNDGTRYTFDVICNPDNVTLKVSNIVLGTEENTLSNLSIYPNPSNGQFTIDLGREYNDVTLQIYNMLGQIISSEKYASAKIIEKEINASAGIYFVKVSTAKEGSNTLRIIKQ